MENKDDLRQEYPMVLMMEMFRFIKLLKELMKKSLVKYLKLKMNQSGCWNIV